MRYDNKRIKTATLSDENSRELLERRNVLSTALYTFPLLAHPTLEERATLDRVGHIWSTGDRLFKLAHQYYGKSELWWIIAWYNERPTDSHYEIGDIVYIPLPLDRILKYLKV